MAKKRKPKNQAPSGAGQADKPKPLTAKEFGQVAANCLLAALMNKN